MHLLGLVVRTLSVIVLAAGLGVHAWAGDWEDGYTAYMSGDYETAFGLFVPLAEQGNAQAMNMLSIMYSNGEGVAENYAESTRWSQLAEAQRAADAIEQSSGTNDAGSNK